jgi:tRNA(Ile)-lysidine synthase
MALASALAFESPKLGIRAGGVTVDHGLQPGSDLRAAEVVQRLRELGLDPVESVVVTVGRAGGPEAAARDARYAALDTAAERHGAAAVLLGHTRDDQAETVLLGLGRGSGARSLSGMREWDAPWCRPLLGLRRAVTRQACAEAGLPVWDDPHNTDPRFTRVRLRHEVLPLLEEVLSGGVAEALARTARQLREDGAALDAVAADLLAAARDEEPGLRLAPLADVPAAVRRRVLRAWLAASDVTALTEEHLRSADVLAGGGPDRGGVALPGGLELVRTRGRLFLRPVRWPSGV